MREYTTPVRQKRPTLASIAATFPFLKHKEYCFAHAFWKTHQRLPMFFIASKYLLRSSDRNSRIFDSVHGINGPRMEPADIAATFNISRERVRQIGLTPYVGSSSHKPVWALGRWSSLPFFNSALLTPANTEWEKLAREEHIDISFPAAMAIFSIVRKLHIVVMQASGQPDTPSARPGFCLAHDPRYDYFRFDSALRLAFHESTLRRICDKHIPIATLLGPSTSVELTDEMRADVTAMLKELLPMLNGITVEGEDYVVHANRTNYVEDIYDIIRRNGQAMHLEELYTAFRELHPDDHHTNSAFLRSYILMDDRIEAVGSKSIYQLREWGHFAGTLPDLAEMLLRKEGGLMRVDALCYRMTEFREQTTLKSCSTSIYLAVAEGRLNYYIDEDNPVTFCEFSPYFVGIAGDPQPANIWDAPVTPAATTSSMRRFVEAHGRWPFPRAATQIEAALFNALQKYRRKLLVPGTRREDIPQLLPDLDTYAYPTTKGDADFKNRCDRLTDFCRTHHRLPYSNEEHSLRLWYLHKRHQRDGLNDFRIHHLRALEAVVQRETEMLPFAD